MPVASMTGFARGDGTDEPYRWAWELRSVNGRGLELRFRLPPGFEFLEPELRTRAQGRLARGNVNATLSVRRAETAQALRVNRAQLDALLAVIEEVGRPRGAPPPRIEQVLGLRGVIESADDDVTEELRDTLGAPLTEGFAKALDALVAARAEEGAKLAVAAGAHLDEIARLTEDARTVAAAQPEETRARIEAQLAQLLGPEPPVAPERLAQEVALLASRADIREELDRLAAHVASARDLMVADEPVGRRLDFLCQEFNREANTLCSKSAQLELTQLGLALKAAVDRLREQVQNIE